MKEKKSRKLFPYIWLGIVFGLSIGLISRLLVYAFTNSLVLHILSFLGILFGIAFLGALLIGLVLVGAEYTEEAISYINGERDDL